MEQQAEQPKHKARSTAKANYKTND